jgi:hypothetical protein
MERLNAKRLLWTLDRNLLIHGAVIWVGLIGAVVVVGLSIALLMSFIALKRADGQLAEEFAALRLARAPTVSVRAQTLPMPVMAQRFEITRRILATLDKAGFQPERIRFKFEDVVDAKLTRQSVVFTLTAPWSQVSHGLMLLQSTDRAIYISKLHVTRDSVDDESVTADVQLAVALNNDGIAQK